MKRKKNLKLSLFLSLIFISVQALALTGSASGVIQDVRVYGDGRVLVTGFTFSGATCNNGSFWIPGDHPNIARLLSAILAAKASGATLTVSAKIDCSWFPEITQDSSTVVIVNPQ
jgi:hypothetical protein